MQCDIEKNQSLLKSLFPGGVKMIYMFICSYIIYKYILYLNRSYHRVTASPN